MENFSRLDPSDLELSTTLSDELQHTLEEIHEAQAPDPRLQKEATDLNAIYRRFHGRNKPEAELQEKLLCDARKKAETYLAEARTPEARLKISGRLWDGFIVPHRDYKNGSFILYFAEFHTALWTEGYPSLEELASAAIQEPAELAAERTGGAASQKEMITTTPDGRGQKRGPKTDYENGSRVAGIVARVAPNGDWKSKLDEICEALDDERIPFPKTWRSKDQNCRSWMAYPEQKLAIMAIQYRLKLAKQRKKATPETVF